MKINEQEAFRIAKRIYRNNFGAYGKGNFDLSLLEFADIIAIAVNEVTEVKADIELSGYYESIK